jgi:hypothetical protein
VVERTGKLVARLVLPASQVVAGFGEAVVYVATTDDDGLVWLSRHPWP